MRILVVLVFTMLLQASNASAQTPTELEAISYVKSAFITGAAAGILAKDVVVAPRLRERLLLPANANATTIYQALFALTEDKEISVRKTSASEAAAYFGPGIAGSPVVVLDAPNTSLVLVYDPNRKQVSFVGLGDRSTASAPSDPRRASH